MQNYNEPARTQLNAESGLVWEELMSGAQTSIEVPKFSVIRVRATGASTVTIGGILAATMIDTEIMLFNAGKGNTTDDKKTVTVTIAVANAFVQVGRTTHPRES